MKVKERMSREPFTVAPEASVDQALKLMQDHGVRHLPVVSDGKVVGMVNDIELRTAWFPSLLDELTVKNVMVSDPATIDADATVYAAARLLYQKKRTGILVVDDGALVGIITLADILKLFVELLGLLGETSRLTVAVRPGTQTLQDIYGMIGAEDCEVCSVALISSDDQRRVYSIRLEAGDAGPVIAALKEAGVEVLD